MKAQTLAQRVETLEQNQEALAAVPRRMTTLEGRMGGLEERMGGLEGRMGGLEGRMGAVEKEVADLRIEMRQGFAAVRAEIESTNEDTRQFMRILCEDLIERIKRLGEAFNAAPRKADGGRKRR